MGFDRYAFKDTGEPVPTQEDVDDALGDDFNREVQAYFDAITTATCPTVASINGARLQGMYIGAAMLGRFDRRLLAPYLAQFVRDVQARHAHLRGTATPPTESTEARVH